MAAHAGSGFGFRGVFDVNKANEVILADETHEVDETDEAYEVAIDGSEPFEGWKAKVQLSWLHNYSLW